MVDDARRTSFDRNAQLYDTARPSYPDALVDAVVAGLPHDARLLELGAGSGKATVLFARRGHPLVALEPGANLAGVLRAKALPNVTVVESTFEAWPIDGAFDRVFAAQAIHWIDPTVRYVKAAAALRDGGMLAVIRNEQDWSDHPLRAELDAAYAAWLPSDDRIAAVASVRAQYTADIDASACFGPVAATTYPWRQRFTTHAYLALLDTYSDHMLLAADRRAGLYAAITAAIEGRGGVIDIAYVSLLLLATRMA